VDTACRGKSIESRLKLNRAGILDFADRQTAYAFRRRPRSFSRFVGSCIHSNDRESNPMGLFPAIPCNCSNKPKVVTGGGYRQNFFGATFFARRYSLN
jgi:hypothetical protein